VLSDKRYPANQIKAWCTKVLTQYQLKLTDARMVAGMLVEADLRNIFSHGVAGGSGLDDIVSKIQKGGINPGYQLTIPTLKERKYPTVVNIDADGGPGHSVAAKSVRLVQKIARKYGVGIVYLYNATHFGVAGLYSEMIAGDQDLIGKVTCITPAWMTPFSQENPECQKKRLGTNPIAWSTPYRDGIVTIDMATSQKAASLALNAGKVNQGKENLSEMKAVPSQYLIDGMGAEVIFPESPEYVRQCSLLPLGGQNYGYKGYGLSVSIELEHIVGGCENTYIQPGLKTAQGRVGQIFEAIALDSRYDRQTALDKISGAVSEIRACGGGFAKLPGQIEQEYRQKYFVEGIPYSNAQIERLMKIGKDAGVPFEIAKW
jgi:L-2-hydroxycarboxylate dehydrogenase (NAD+)